MLENRYLVKISRIIHRNLIKYSADSRPGSYPFVTGDGFRKLAQHVFEDDSLAFRPERVQPGDVVFLGNSHIKEFFEKYHPLITAKYTLVSHNGDEAINAEVVSYIDEKIIKWYGINVTASHAKVIPIPLGIENLHYYVLGIPGNFVEVKKLNLPKKDRIFYGFTVGTNPQKRQPALDYLAAHPLTDTLKGQWLTFGPYLKLLAGYKFTASPEGSSIEGHRNWDALYMGVTPIVTKSATTEYFKSLGIPMWVLDDWHELDGLKEDDLNKKYKELWHGFDESKLYMDFWTNKIKTLA